MRSIGVVFTVGLAFFTTACTTRPQAYAPPAQIVMPAGPEPAASAGNGLLFAMSDPDANQHILADVFSAGSGEEWRFTGLHSKFRFEISRLSRLGFYMRFYNSAEALAARGPASFSITVNGNRFESPRFIGAGDQEYRRPIPDGWIAHPGVIDVSLDVDRGWRSSDGTTYGILLNSIGFEERER